MTDRQEQLQDGITERDDLRFMKRKTEESDRTVTAGAELSEGSPDPLSTENLPNPELIVGKSPESGTNRRLTPEDRSRTSRARNIKSFMH